MSEEREILWEATVTPTEEELYVALCRGEPRKAGRIRLAVQTVLLIIVVVWSILPSLMGGRGDYMLAAVAVAVAVAMWVVPPLKRRSDARTQARSGVTFRLRVCEEALLFGDTPVPYEQVTAFEDPGQITLLFEEELLLIPKRSLPAEAFHFLSRKLPLS